MVSRSVRSIGSVAASSMTCGYASEWAVLLPAWSVMLILFTYATYFALALARTPSFDEICTITGTAYMFDLYSPRLIIAPQMPARIT
jgi:hypothetical protein